MDIFGTRNRLITDYKSYITSFINIRDERVSDYVQQTLDDGALWPDPLIQLNPAFEPGETIDDLVAEGTLHPDCARVFRIKSDIDNLGRPMRLHRHQTEAIRTARGGHNYVLTTGTGSGKSLAYIVPIVDYVLRTGSKKGIQAICVFPMNALANSQQGELEKFLTYGYPDGKGPVTFRKYTGQEPEAERELIRADPPNILLTNYVMLELLMTRPIEQRLIDAAQGLRFLVLDELHTYRGRQGADVGLLVRRVRDRFSSPDMQTVGTSATLAGAGSFDQQRGEVARVATQLFGAAVKPEHVIGETLKRSTPERDHSDPSFRDELKQQVLDDDTGSPAPYADFITRPLSTWLEDTFGLTSESQGGRLVRKTPLSIRGEGGAAEKLSALTGVPVERTASAIQAGLLAGTHSQPDPETGRRPFAFRLHQFISRGDSVYATLEPEEERYITLYGQQFRPGDRSLVLLPLVFCRECGQEYYCVKKALDPETSRTVYLQRSLGDISDDDHTEPGFLYVSTAKPWPAEYEDILRRVPADWLEMVDGSPELLRHRREYLPEAVQVDTRGQHAEKGLACHFIKAPFRFCLQCEVAYDFQQNSDFAKLAALSSEGRSTATTILSMSAIRTLKADDTLDPKARKLLSFTDNRQDASLQAGHFNDFVEIGQLRSALYRAALASGEGLGYDVLTQKVFDALNMDIEEYASDPEVRFQALHDTNRALRDVLGYRLYRDLKRGWRVTSPNLEQCGLLEIRYVSLDEVCGAEDLWEKRHQALADANPQTRMKIAKTLLDYMRRELAIKVDYLDQRAQERIQQQSNQRLKDPWAIDENEVGKMEYSTTLYPRSRGRYDSRTSIFLSPRGGFGQYLRRATTFGDTGVKLTMDDVRSVIADLLDALRFGGLVEVVEPAKKEKEEDVPGYQLPASAMLWVAGTGERPFHDPIRVPNQPAKGGKANPFFIDFYAHAAASVGTLQAREHTAQVPYELREQREEDFRAGKLPILYCSPTMELGVDISELNVVNMRNIPPTPANYAQRSGRAGRSGQPALVFSYCTTGSPHDQYFFRHPQDMVSGAVTPPRLDMTNEDLVRAHVHSIWLAETGQSLGKSLKDLLDVSAGNEQPTLALLPEVRDSISNPRAGDRAQARAQRMLDSLGDELRAAEWYSEGWLGEVISQAVLRFDQTCERWRNLYRSALNQVEVQHLIIRDASRGMEDKNQAKRLRREAEAQLELLTEVDNLAQSDFYSYRYFASEGFLPGYSFPRLPISAFIPARRAKQKDEFLSRSRFLAISEFGPRSVIYHEGSRYLINKVILPVREDDGQGSAQGRGQAAGEGQEDALTRDAKLCKSCGYLHPISGGGGGQDLCEWCKAPLDGSLKKLFRLQNVSTRRRDRINSDEEERTRLGYDIITGVRFAEHDGHPSYRSATVGQGEDKLASLTYGHTATIWRINLGWRRRKNKQQYGFVLDMERGYWEKSDQVEDDDISDPMSQSKQRVIPYVEDRRNCLLIEPAQLLDQGMTTSLMSALKSAIQVRYQLEDGELAVEMLPEGEQQKMLPQGEHPKLLPVEKQPKLLLFYESAEGGAGVLKRLLDSPSALAEVAQEALRLCHFDPHSGEDLHRAPRSREDCEAACYDCLMNYHNQRHHRLLDRRLIKDILMAMSQAKVVADGSKNGPNGGNGKNGYSHLEWLKQQAGSTLERRWLEHLSARGLRLPEKAQALVETCKTRPDFLYDGDYQAAIYIDGPIHEYETRHTRDVALTECMEDRGYIVIRFTHSEDWDQKIAKYPYIFGKEK